MPGCTGSRGKYSVFAGNHPSSPCPLTINPPNAAVRYGDPLWANCSASTKQVQGMGWESSQGGIPLTGGVRSVALNIPSVTDWGLSSFCYINTLDGNQCKETLQVIVYSKFWNRYFVLSHLLLMVMKLPKYCDISCSLPPHRNAR